MPLPYGGEITPIEDAIRRVPYEGLKSWAKPAKAKPAPKPKPAGKPGKKRK